MSNPFDLVQLSQALAPLPEFVELAFKKLAKKDMSTRLKGLEELHSGILQADLDWPVFWPRFLPLLFKGMMDSERQVRHAHASLLLKIRDHLPWDSYKFQYILLGAQRDPVLGVRKVVNSLVSAEPLDYASLEKEALDWLRVKADKLLEGLVKDAESIQEPAERQSSLQLAQNFRDLAVHRAISVLSSIKYLSSEASSLVQALKYQVQPALVRAALLHFYAQHEVTLSDGLQREILKETSPELLLPIVGLLDNIGSVDFVYNVVNSAPFDNIPEIVKKLPPDAYGQVLWPAFQRFKVIYDERKIKFMLVLAIELIRDDEHLVRDFLERSTLKGEAPFGVYDLENATSLFPEDVGLAMLREWMHNTTLDLNLKRHARLFEACSHRFPQEARQRWAQLGHKLDLGLLKLMPSLIDVYLADRAQVQADLLKSPKAVIALLPSLEYLSPQTKEQFDAILEYNPSLLKEASPETLRSHYPSAALFKLACQIEHLPLAFACMEDVDVLAPDSIPGAWALNTDLCRLALKNSQYSVVELFDACTLSKTIEEDWVNNPDIAWQELRKLLGHVHRADLVFEAPEMVNIPDLINPMRHLLPLFRISGACDIDHLARLACLPYHKRQPAWLPACYLFLREACGFVLSVDHLSIGDPRATFKLSRELGNYYSLALEAGAIDDEVLIACMQEKRPNPHHRIVISTMWARRHPKEALNRLRGILFSDGDNEDGCDDELGVCSLAVARADVSVTSDIISGLLVRSNGLKRVALLRMLPKAVMSPEFIDSHRDPISNLVLQEMMAADANTQDLALACITALQFLQQEHVMNQVLGLFKSVQMPSATLYRCARIAFVTEPFDAELILRLMLPISSLESYIQALLMARFLFILGHDPLITEIGSKQDVPTWFSRLFENKDNILGDAMAWEMLLGLAEGCRGVNSRDDSIAMDRIQTFLQSRIDQALDAIFVHSLLPAEEEEGSWTLFDVETLTTESYKTWCGNLLYRTMRLLPMLFSPHKSNEALNKTFALACKLIKRQQIARLRGRKDQGIAVIASSTQTDVQCDYTFEDATLSLLLKLPSDFPLSPPEISIPRSSRLAATRTRNALLAAQSMLLQRCDLTEGLQSWRASLDASFAGTEPCAICYCVMCPHDGGRALPVPKCRKCQHKFHAFCLYKWFKSSGHSTCPMCRSLF